MKLNFKINCFRIYDYLQLNKEEFMTFLPLVIEFISRNLFEIKKTGINFSKFCEKTNKLRILLCFFPSIEYLLEHSFGKDMNEISIKPNLKKPKKYEKENQKSEIRISCPFDKYGCNQNLVFRDVSSHLSCCPHKFFLCPNCNSNSTSRDEMIMHLIECDKNLFDY